MPPNLNDLLKECIVEVLKEDLTEAFDPTSQGPNIPGENPYPEWNEKMRRLEEDGDHESTIRRVKKEVYDALAAAGFERKGDEPRDYMEFYRYNFMTVQIGISFDTRDAIVERYYDSEMVDNIPGHHVNQRVPIPEQYNPEFVRKLIRYTIALKKSGERDESIFAGIDDLAESGQRIQSTEIPWQCPHCKKETNIHVDVESPSDYIASNECEHCGQEINDPNLDAKVMQGIADYFAGRADYYKDLLREGFGGATLSHAKITGIQPVSRGVGKAQGYIQYKATVELELNAWADTEDKQSVAKDVYSRIQSAFR